MMSISNVVLITLSIISLLVSIIATFFANIVSKEIQQMKQEEKRLKLEEEILKTAKIEVSQESLNKIGVQLKMLPKNYEPKIIEVEGKRRFSSTGTDS